MAVGIWGLAAVEDIDFSLLTREIYAHGFGRRLSPKQIGYFSRRDNRGGRGVSMACPQHESFDECCQKRTSVENSCQKVLRLPAHLCLSRNHAPKRQCSSTSSRLNFDFLSKPTALRAPPVAEVCDLEAAKRKKRRVPLRTGLALYYVAWAVSEELDSYPRAHENSSWKQITVKADV